MTPYQKLLRHPLWQRRRLEILELADFTCQICASTEKTLHVDHKLYRKGAKPWEYSDEELEALCEDCHEEIGRVRKRLNAAIAVLDDQALRQVLGYAMAQAACSGDPPPAGLDYWEIVGWLEGIPSPTKTSSWKAMQIYEAGRQPAK